MATLTLLVAKKVILPPKSGKTDCDSEFVYLQGT